MAGIAGIATVNAVERVRGMLGRIRHRGMEGISVFEKDGTTMGMVWNKSEIERAGKFVAAGIVSDEISPYHYARVRPENGKFIMNRDDHGVAPLYYGKDKAGNMCFASEIKALLAVTDEISEMPPGNCFDGTLTSPLFTLETGPVSEDPPEELAIKLRNHLDEAVKRCIKSEDIGSWLSGGVDSSAICALAARYLKVFKTFTAGVKGAPDLEFSREMARFIRSEHHELTVTSNELISNLPDVIFHLESFDALLVRSSILNFLVARMASDHVSEVFSGEGGDRKSVV